MVEIIELVKQVLFIPIPFPISLNTIYYYNLFGLGIVLFMIFIVSLILYRLTK